MTDFKIEKSPEYNQESPEVQGSPDIAVMSSVMDLGYSLSP